MGRQPKQKKLKTPDPHEHEWTVYGHRGMGGVRGKTFIALRCKVEGCREHNERPATEAERKKIRADWVQNERRQKLMHVAWRPIQKVLKDFGSPTDQDTKAQLTSKLDRLAQKFPEYVEYVRTDDDYHCGSDLYFVSHKYDDKKIGKGYWGTTVIFIAQCSPDPPVRFFLYPNHMAGLLDAVKKLYAAERKLNAGKKPWEV